MISDLYIIDLGKDKPSNERYALGTVEEEPFCGKGKWVRIEVESKDVHSRLHMPRIEAESIKDIVRVGPKDDVTKNLSCKRK